MNKHRCKKHLPKIFVENNVKSRKIWKRWQNYCI